MTGAGVKSTFREQRLDCFVYPNRDHGLSEGKQSTVHVRMMIARHLIELNTCLWAHAEWTFAPDFLPAIRFRACRTGNVRTGIGGGEFTSFLDQATMDQDLIVRSPRQDGTTIAQPRKSRLRLQCAAVVVRPEEARNRTPVRAVWIPLQ